jgi:diguanylate cyclase (GGDEF)-like protein
MTRASLYDAETGLPTRDLITDRLGMALRGAARTRHEVGVVLVTLAAVESADGSPAPAGAVSAVVKEVADRLAAAVRGVDSVGRYGPETFALVIQGVVDDESFRVLARRLLFELSPPVTVDLRPYFVLVRIGGTTARPGGDDAATMLRRADEALAEAEQPDSDLFVLRAP